MEPQTFKGHDLLEQMSYFNGPDLIISWLYNQTENLQNLILSKQSGAT